MFSYTVVYMVLFLACNTQASEVILTSNLTSGNLAYNDQVIVFRCITRGAILIWESDDYIGPITDGRDLRLSFVDQPGHTESSQLVDGTVASLISVTNVNGDTVIESELRIMASLATSLSSAVTCTNNGLGGRNTTEFRVVSQIVELTSNLTDGNIAYNDQVIVFRCITRGAILIWQSDDYIGPIADGRDLRLSFVDQPGHTERSQLVDGTVARVINIVDDMDGTLIESELVIRASLSMQSSSVTCTNNGLGRMNTTYFRVTERPSITTTPATLPESSTATSSIDSFTGGTSTEESVSDPGPQDGSNVGVAVGVSVFVLTIAAAIIVAIIIAVVYFITLRTRTRKVILEPIEKGDGLEYKVVPMDQPPPGDRTPPDVSKQPGSTVNEKDSIDPVEVSCIRSEPEENFGILVSSPDPKEQLGDFRLTEAKQNVENPEGFPGDAGAIGASKEFEGEADDPLSPSEDIGSQEAVGCIGPNEDTMVHEPIPESGRDNLIVPKAETNYSLEQSVRVGPSSLPSGHRTCLEQSYTGAKAKPISLPLPQRESMGSTHAHQHHVNLHVDSFITQQHEVDTDNESDTDTGTSSNALDAFLFPSSSTPLTSLQLDPNGSPFMVSGSVMASQSSSRPSMTPLALNMELDAECNHGISQPEEVVEEIADAHSEANNGIHQWSVLCVEKARV